MRSLQKTTSDGFKAQPHRDALTKDGQSAVRHHVGLSKFQGVIDLHVSRERLTVVISVWLLDTLVLR